jgi:hypothetical protein
MALALDRNPFEDLRAAARALDHEEVHAQAVTRLEAGNPAQLGALDVVNDSAHGKEKARQRSPPRTRPES